MSIKFDYDIFKEWFDFNNLSRNKLIKTLGQQDPNKVGRWLTGQVIGTEDLISLCNHYNLQIADFLIISNDEDGKQIKSAIPDRMKDKREAVKIQQAPDNIMAIANQSTLNTGKSEALDDKEIALARQSIMYEKKINALMVAHSTELREKDAYMRQQLRERMELVNTLQNSITVLNQDMSNKQKSEEILQDTIKQLQLTIQQQQNTIASYDAIIRKQKKIPSQPSPFFSGQATMVQDGGGAISAAPSQNND